MIFEFDLFLGIDVVSILEKREKRNMRGSKIMNLAFLIMYFVERCDWFGLNKIIQRTFLQTLQYNDKINS